MRPDEHKRRKSAQYQNKKKHTASDKHEGKLPVKKDVDENLKRTSTENSVSEYESKCRLGLISISEVRNYIFSCQPGYMYEIVSVHSAGTTW